MRVQPPPNGQSGILMPLKRWANVISINSEEQNDYKPMARRTSCSLGGTAVSFSARSAMMSGSFNP